MVIICEYYSVSEFYNVCGFKNFMSDNLRLHDLIK